MKGPFQAGARPSNSLKPILFLDADFLIDIHGRPPDGSPFGSAFDHRLGAAVLNGLSRKYDLRITTTVLDEATYGRRKFGAVERWFWRNRDRVVIYPTPEFHSGPDKGERSIMSVIMPGGLHHDRSLPPFSDVFRLKVASRDRRYFGGSPLRGNTLSTQRLMEEALKDGTLSRGVYDWLGAVSGPVLRRCGGYRPSKDVLARHAQAGGHHPHHRGHRGPSRH